jgi:hypothetical protein
MKEKNKNIRRENYSDIGERERGKRVKESYFDACAFFFQSMSKQTKTN